MKQTLPWAAFGHGAGCSDRTGANRELSKRFQKKHGPPGAKQLSTDFSSFKIINTWLSWT